MILPPATIGVLGGGQLGRYFVMAAHQLGYKVIVLDPDDLSPAGRISDKHIIADYNNKSALDEIIKECKAVTIEFENVSADVLDYLSKFIPVRPSADAVRICQNRSLEKGFLSANGFTTVEYININSEQDIFNLNNNLFPGILKLISFGYDGKGQIIVNNKQEAIEAFISLNLAPCILEQKLNLESEISVIIARNENGETECFPVAENHHINNILDASYVPYTLGRSENNLINIMAKKIAVEIADKLSYIGVLCVEFFIANNGKLFINELAPRPHNSGHYTIDACVTSQFEQQVRALCGLPLGDASSFSAAVMVNLLGDLWHGDNNNIIEPNWNSLLALSNSIKLHLYGKNAPKFGRKMGHFTVINQDLIQAQQIAELAKSHFKLT